MRLYTSGEASELFANAGMGPTIFIECTETFVSGRNTGIQRVVRNISKHAQRLGAKRGINVVTVTLVGDKLAYADLSSAPTATPERMPFWKRTLWRKLQSTLCGVLPSKRFRQFVYAKRDTTGLALMISNPWGFVSRVANLHPTLDDINDLSNCVLLLLDSDWHLPVKEPIRKFKERGGIVISVVYDLIPITHGHTCDPSLVSVFTAWTNYILSECKDFIAISKASATVLTKYARGNGNFLPPVSHFLLGSDLDLADGPISPSIKNVFEASREPKFIIVGSIEPRKNHTYALDAFEGYWSRGGAGSLIIIGKWGWMNKEIIDRIFAHPEFGERLFLLRDASDADLDYAYKSASALIFPSIAEGFGLPIVEAFQRGLSVLCSDIPVFREVAEDHAQFFDLSDQDSLADELLSFQKADVSSANWITWEESAEQIMDDVERRLYAARTTGCSTQ